MELMICIRCAVVNKNDPWSEISCFQIKNLRINFIIRLLAYLDIKLDVNPAWSHDTVLSITVEWDEHWSCVYKESISVQAHESSV